MNLPAGLLEQIIEARGYAAAKAANQGDPHGWQQSPLRTLAMQIEFELAQEDIGA